jgi:hypothetical protein
MVAEQLDDGLTSHLFQRLSIKSLAFKPHGPLKHARDPPGNPKSLTDSG